MLSSKGRPVLAFLLLLVFLAGCSQPDSSQREALDQNDTEPMSDSRSVDVPVPDFSLGIEDTHNKFSRTIEPRLRVPSGAVVELHTKEASDGQFTPESVDEDVVNLDFEPIHPLTGPIYVEGAVAGDVLKVQLHEIEVGDWGWTAITPGFSFLAEEFKEPKLKTFRFEPGATEAEFNDSVRIPLAPFPGVMGVAPDTDELLNTIPPRKNGGNMDNRHMIAGTTIYFPVLVDGALFSIGDTHAAQGDGEVCGTALEAPMRIVLQLEVLKDRSIEEAHYEGDDFYAVTAYGTDIDQAAKKATRYMLDYLVEQKGMNREDAFMLASLAGDLKISEVVDMPHYLVSMHMPKRVFR